jgi:IS1 family transposase/transposase-like protein
MIVAACEHAWKKNGFDKNGNPRKRCKVCGTSYVDRQFTALGEMRIDLDQAAQAINLLCEGMSIRAVCRLTGLHMDTVLRIIVRAGRGIAEYSERTIRGLTVDEVECDELWAFIYCKKRTQRTRDLGSEVGDLYCFLGIDRNTKLILATAYGKRDTETGACFMQRLRRAAPTIGQLSTDGWQPYAGLVSLLWRDDVNYGQISKVVQGGPAVNAATRYSPGKLRSVSRKPDIGNPKRDRISTSMAERVNLSIRMGVRRMTRLTNAFSKKWSNHHAMMDLFFGVYNFCKVHGTLKTTPAVAAGLTDHVWTIRELLEKTESTH